jgi:hypothetical protein
MRGASDGCWCQRAAGQMPDLARVEDGDFCVVDAADPEEGVRKLLAIVQERIPKRFRLDRYETSRCSAR